MRLSNWIRHRALMLKFTLTFHVKKYYSFNNNEQIYALVKKTFENWMWTFNVLSDSQKLLLYVLENEYVTKEDMNELDCDGRTIIQTVVNTKHIRCTNRLEPLSMIIQSPPPL